MGVSVSPASVFFFFLAGDEKTDRGKIPSRQKKEEAQAAIALAGCSIQRASKRKRDEAERCFHFPGPVFHKSQTRKANHTSTRAHRLGQLAGAGGLSLLEFVFRFEFVSFFVLWFPLGCVFVVLF